MDDLVFSFLLEYRYEYNNARLIEWFLNKFGRVLNIDRGRLIDLVKNITQIAKT
jgi:hypothetical protein